MLIVTAVGDTSGRAKDRRGRLRALDATSDLESILFTISLLSAPCASLSFYLFLLYSYQLARVEVSILLDWEYGVIATMTVASRVMMFVQINTVGMERMIQRPARRLSSSMKYLDAQSLKSSQEE